MYYTLTNIKKSNKMFSYDLANLIIENKKPPVFVCVGSNKIVEDSLGALTGELLINYYKINAKVLGNLSHALVGENLKKVLNEITSNYFNHTIIVIDSSVGKLDKLYDVNLTSTGLNIDFQNSNKFFGNIGISSVTYLKGINDLLLLNSEKKKCMFKVANFIASGIYNALKICEDLNHKLAI